MLTEKCTENCIETTEGISAVQPCSEGTITSDCIVIGEDMNLCALNIKSETSIKKVIKDIDKILCDIKGSSLTVLYDNIVVDGSCIGKQLVNVNGKPSIKLFLDKDCLCTFIEDCITNENVKAPFIISATKYSICRDQKTILTSKFNETIWYNENGAIIGNGINKEVSLGGNYYGVFNGKISNIINVIYTADCPTFTYTKVKNFYKNCILPTVSTEYTYSKIYLSETSYQDALLKAELDAIVFDTQGQAIINATGICIGESNPTPIPPSCFNVFLSNVNCNNSPSPTPVPIPIPIPTPTPIRTDYWNLNLCSGGNATYQVDNLNLNAGITLKDNISGICYTTVNQGALVAPLLTNYIETGGDCATCLSIPTPPNGGVISVLQDLEIPQVTQWNYFNPNDIPDFNPVKSVDAKTGELLPNKWFIWHTPYRNLFGTTQTSQLVSLFKKGITSINGSKIGGYYNGIESIITADRMVGDAGAGLNTPVDDNYTSFENWATEGFGYANTYKIPTLNGKSRAFLVIQDYEGDYADLTTQMSANLHTIALWKGVNTGNGRYGFQYGGGKNSASYATSRLYTAESNNVWNLPADNTVPLYYQGKSAAGNDRIIGMFELAFTYEAFLPEGYQVKDQNGFNWFRISHFGSECDNTYGYNSLANANNWAAQLGTHCETYYGYHKLLNQDVIAQIKPTNESDDGFHYNVKNSQYNQGRYIQQFYENGITYLEGACNCEQKSTLGSEYVTPFIAEGQVILTYFSGVKGINWWSSDFTDVAIPRAKSGNQRRGAKYNDPNYGNRDLESYVYTLKALWRLNQKVTLNNGQSYSFNEICDGTEVYLNQTTKVVYDTNGLTTQYRALDWQILKKSPVRAVVNVSKNVVFVVAFQAYGVEQSQITFKLTDYGANISELIDVPAGKIVVRAFPLTGGTVPTPVPTPIPTPVPTPVPTPTPVPPSPSVIITQPNKPQYFFSNNQPPTFYSNRSNLPVIFTNGEEFNAIDDIVYLENSEVKYGINLKRGGQLCYASIAGSTDNLIFNGYDGGFQGVIDATQILDPATIQGQTSGSPQNNNAYNTTMGGTHLNQSQTLMEYKPVGSNAYYVKFRPLLYPFNALISEVEIEVTYTLIGRALKTTYKYTSFRTDGNFPLNPTFPSGIKGWAVPICFLIEKLNRYQIYAGDAPFTNAPVQDGVIPNTTPNQGGGSIIGFNTKEFWGLSYNQIDNVGLGIMNLSEGGSSSYLRFEQREKRADSPPSGVFGNRPRTTMEIAISVLVPDGGNFVKETTAYFSVGSPAQIRQSFYNNAIV